FGAHRRRSLAATVLRELPHDRGGRARDRGRRTRARRATCGARRRMTDPDDGELASDLLPAERKVLDAVGHLPLDFRAMWAVSNLFRSSTAIRRHMEANVLATDRLSWTAFTGLWVLWIWGEMETRDFAAAVGISRPTATGVVTTLEGREFVRRRRNEQDG